MFMDEGIATPEVYQLRIALREISPAIWRRVLVRSDSTIADLHYTLQLGVDPTVATPAAISITERPVSCSCRGRIARMG